MNFSAKLNLFSDMTQKIVTQIVLLVLWCSNPKQLQKIVTVSSFRPKIVVGWCVSLHYYRLGFVLLILLLITKNSKLLECFLKDCYNFIDFVAIMKLNLLDSLHICIIFAG